MQIAGKLTRPFFTEMEHLPTGTRIETAAPKDAGGDASRFSPIDLVAAALASCAATAMNIHAQKNDIRLGTVEFAISAETATDPRRIVQLTLRCRIAADCSDEAFESLVKAGKSCPVRLSLHPDLKIIEDFARIDVR